MMRNMFNKNLAAKILALISAFVLWIYVTNEQNPPVEAALTVALETRNVTSPLVAVDAPDAVKVKLRGSRSIIAGLQAQDIKCYIDLKGLAEGRHNIKVLAQVPPGLELLEVNPDKIQVRLDSSFSRKMPAEIRLTGNAATGTAVAKVAASPEQITVEGPRTLVESIDKALLPIDLTGKNADFGIAVVPVLLDREGKAVEGTIVYPDKVNVNVALLKGLSQKTVEVKPIIYGDTAQGYEVKEIFLKPAKIDINGSPQSLEQIDFVYTEPVNIAGLSQNTSKEAKLQLKEGVLASQNMVAVQITVGARH